MPPNASKLKFALAASTPPILNTVPVGGDGNAVALSEIVWTAVKVLAVRLAFRSSAACKSVCAERVPVIVPQVGMPPVDAPDALNLIATGVAANLAFPFVV